MGFYEPVGGHIVQVANGVVVHFCPCKAIFGFETGAAAMAVEVPGKDRAIAIINPTPYGQESLEILKTLQPDVGPAGKFNVKYLIAQNLKHHLGLSTWTERYPNAKVVGPDGLEEKKSQNNVKVAYKFTTAQSTPEQVGLPRDLTAILDFAYFPVPQIHDIVVFHKPSRTMIVADLLFNLPAYEQYKDHHIDPTAGRGYLTHWIGIDSFLTRFLSRYGAKHAPSAVARLIDWHADRIVLCHGNLIEGAELVHEKLDNMFGDIVQKAHRL
jgi:hypothetical protein